MKRYIMIWSVSYKESDIFCPQQLDLLNFANMIQTIKLISSCSHWMINIVWNWNLCEQVRSSKAVIEAHNSEYLEHVWILKDLCPPCTVSGRTSAVLFSSTKRVLTLTRSYGSSKEGHHLHHRLFHSRSINLGRYNYKCQVGISLISPHKPSV